MAPTACRQYIRDCALLVRGRVSLMVAVAAAFGYLLVQPVMDVGLCWTVAGTALLAWACSVWNQVQERELDALLPRTKQRPLPCGRVSVRTAFFMGLIFFLAALACLGRAGGATSVLMALGIAAVYNGLYTPLKRMSAFALLIGALVGALPPVLGWVCAGGSAAAPELLLVYGVYTLWQVPHFWLRVERDSDAYARAGLPLPPAQFSGPRYRRLLRLWFHAYAAALLLLPVFPFVSGSYARVGLALLGIVLFVCGGLVLRPGAEAHDRAQNARSILRLTDGGMVTAMVILLLDRFLPVFL